MNVKQAAKLTGIAEAILLRMRARESTSFKSGPPYCKVMDEYGNTHYEYDREQVLDWMKSRRCLITAADAAKILGVSRTSILTVNGCKSYYLRSKDNFGKLIINNAKNIYIWLPRVSYKEVA